MTIARPAGVAFRAAARLPGWRAAERSVPVRRIERIGPEYWRVGFESWPELAASRPGQFVMVRPERDRHVLRRPFTIYASPDGECEIVFRVTGCGTRALAGLVPGQLVSVLGPLGNGFETAGVRRAIVLARGVGLASLDRLARRFLADRVPTSVLASARSRELWLEVAALRAAGAEVLTLDDRSGSSSVDHVTRLLEARFTEGAECYVCGSRRLIRLAARLGNRHGVAVHAALEAPMACGVGTCHACPVDPAADIEGPLVCVDGPVFDVVEARLA